MALILNQAIYLLFTIGMAYYHSQLIKKNKPIRHGLWAAIAIAVAGLFALINFLYLPTLIFLRAFVFSPALNLFRGLPINYTSPTSTSILDKFERKLLPNNTRWYFYGGFLIICEISLYLNS